MIFDGKGFAREIEATLRLRLRSGERVPKIVSVLVGNDPASELYTRLKKQVAERVGIVFIVSRVGIVDLEVTMKTLANDESVAGIMIQLPIPGLDKQQTQNYIDLIPLQKDVDGLRWEESGVKPAAVRAILSIVERVAKDKKEFVIVGAAGAVGRPLAKFLREQGKQVVEIEAETANPGELIRTGEVVISCVGKASLITHDMVSNGLIAIDVGMSEVGGRVVGDMTQEVYQKASMAVTVPGGVGPVTIVSLMENVTELVV